MSTKPNNIFVLHGQDSLDSTAYFCLREDGMFVIGTIPSDQPNIGFSQNAAIELAQFILKRCRKSKK